MCNYSFPAQKYHGTLGIDGRMIYVSSTRPDSLLASDGIAGAGRVPDCSAAPSATQFFAVI
jgi:hypothetical protein